MNMKVDELNTITTLNDELSTKLENNNTEKLSLICRVNESVETIHKMANEKKEITMKLEEAHNGRNDLQIALNCMHTKVETTEKEINNLKRDMESKIKEHEHITEVANSHIEDLQNQSQSKSALIKEIGAKTEDLEKELQAIRKE